MACVGSDMKGMSGMAIPRSECDISHQILCECNESTEHTTTLVFNALNLDILLFRATNSLKQIWELQIITIKIEKN